MRRHPQSPVLNAILGVPILLACAMVIIPLVIVNEVARRVLR